jgi:hypothetical protein
MSLFSNIKILTIRNSLSGLLLVEHFISVLNVLSELILVSCQMGLLTGSSDVKVVFYVFGLDINVKLALPMISRFIVCPLFSHVIVLIVSNLYAIRI